MVDTIVLTLSLSVGFLALGRSTEAIHKYIHDEPRAEIREISYMWRDSRIPDGKRSGLHSFYYILNNLIRNTINPKDGAASDINGYVRNVLARFAPGGDRFNVPRFLWTELRLTVEDGRRGLPYAPYLMFMIERVTRLYFPKDMMHTVYKIEKTQPVAASQATGGGSFAAHEDILESSCSRSHRGGRMKKLSKWLKAIFGKCTYAVDRAYETQLEQRQQHGQDLPLLPPIPPPPQFDLPSLSDTESDDDDEEEEEEEE
jgi:hypothetical protein